MTEQFYGDDSVRIKKTAKEEWVQSEFREQERYRRNYYGTIFLEILLDKMQQKERVLYIETVKAPRVVRMKRRKKDLDPKKCDEVERQKETVTKNCDAHKPKESMVSGTRSVPPAQNVQDMPVVPEIRLSNGSEEQRRGSHAELRRSTDMSQESRNAGSSQGGNQCSTAYSMECCSVKYCSMEGCSMEASASVSKTGLTPVQKETILVWASGDILELTVMSELPEISGTYNARACMV